jgi:hypothetical protein
MFPQSLRSALDYHPTNITFQTLDRRMISSSRLYLLDQELGCNLYFFSFAMKRSCINKTTMPTYLIASYTLSADHSDFD